MLRCVKFATQGSGGGQLGDRRLESEPAGGAERLDQLRAERGPTDRHRLRLLRRESRLERRPEPLAAAAGDGIVFVLNPDTPAQNALVELVAGTRSAPGRNRRGASSRWSTQNTTTHRPVTPAGPARLHDGSARAVQPLWRRRLRPFPAPLRRCRLLLADARGRVAGGDGSRSPRVHDKRLRFRWSLEPLIWRGFGRRRERGLGSAPAGRIDRTPWGGFVSRWSARRTSGWLATPLIEQ